MLTKEKSESLAGDIMNIELLILCMDFDYISDFLKEMQSAYQFQSSIGFIAPNYVPEAEDVVKEQIEALKILVSYKEKLDKIKLLKQKVEHSRKSRMRLNDLFY